MDDSFTIYSSTQYPEKFHDHDCNWLVEIRYDARTNALRKRINDDNYTCGGKWSAPYLLPVFFEYPTPVCSFACHPLCSPIGHLNRFTHVNKEMKLLNGSTFFDYMQPFRDTQDALFRLIMQMRYAWIPCPSTSWELSHSAYATHNLTELLESVLSCPICLEISNLGLYYECTHECCESCQERNEQRLCGQCRKPQRLNGHTPNTMDDDRLRQFNDVLKKILYRCPCGQGDCKHTTFADAHKSECPHRLMCPLAGDKGCSFRAGAGHKLLLAHLTEFHPIEHLWERYRSAMFRAKVQADITDPWIMKDKLIELLILS